MEKNKKLIIGGVAACLLLVGGVAAFFVLHKPAQQQQLSLLSDSSDGGTTTNAVSGSDGQAIPLNQTPSADNTKNSGLSVSNSTASNGLGQTNQKQSAQGTSQNSGSSNGSNPFDTSTFGQYEKYKTGTSALFGDAIKGDGTELTEGKKAAVYYRGWLTNGTLFDESRKGNDGNLQPFVFQLGAHQVIPGWEQALAGMKVGGVRLVIVPPAVGYGANAQGSIPANSVLIFQVQLAAVQ